MLLCADDTNVLYKNLDPKSKTDTNNNIYYPTSTPAKNKTNIDKTHPIFINKQKKFKIMILNCNVVKGPSKQAALPVTLDVHIPDIVLGCVIQCALMNSSLRTTTSFVKIAM